MFDKELSIDTAGALLKAHGERLRALVGKTIEATWVAWDIARDEWFPDEAVIIEAGGTSLEIVCWKLSDIVLTWGSIDRSQPPQWVASWSSDFSLEWRRDALSDLRNSVGKCITGINVVEYLHRTTVIDDKRDPTNIGRQDEEWLLNGLELEFQWSTLTIFNALDENGVTSQRFAGEEFRRVAV